MAGSPHPGRCGFMMLTRFYSRTATSGRRAWIRMSRNAGSAVGPNARRGNVVYRPFRAATVRAQTLRYCNFHRSESGMSTSRGRQQGRVVPGVGIIRRPRNRSERFALLLAILLASCAPSPEDLVREVLRAAELAAEQGRAHDLSRLVSARYTDVDGRTGDELVRIATDYVAGRQPLYLLVVERRLSRVDAAGEIESELLVAAASVPLESLFDLSRASADVGVVTLRFVEDAPRAWRIASADWRPASPADLLQR